MRAWPLAKHVVSRHAAQTARAALRLDLAAHPACRGVSCASNTYGWNPTTNPAPEAPWRDQATVEWPDFLGLDTWLGTLDLVAIKAEYSQNGYAVIPEIIPHDVLSIYADLHERMTQGDIDTRTHRHDLGSHTDEVIQGKENVGQIQWPMDFVKDGREGPLHQRAFAICQELMGADTAFDFDMTIWKEAYTATETPWHQDEAYWPSGMIDKRAITVWCALDAATIDNGAMWFVKGSHKQPLLQHQTAGDGSHILMTREVSETTPGATCVPLAPGSAVLWHGRTVHYARGNSTGNSRRTFITNFRPELMVKWERENGFDHLRLGFADYEAQKEASGDVYKLSFTTAETIKSAFSK